MLFPIQTVSDQNLTTTTESVHEDGGHITLMESKCVNEYPL